MIRSTYDVLATLGGAATLLLLVLFLLGPRRKFWILAVYAGGELLGSLALTIFDLKRSPAQRTLYSHFYWTYEVAVDLLLFLVVIALTHEAVPAGAPRRKVDRFLGAVVFVVLALPFVALHPNFRPWPSPRWFNSAGEILNFGAAVMNLGLWGALIASRERDAQMFRVSAGLGIRVAGTAMAYGIRHFVPPGVSEAVPNLLLMLAQIAEWTILCWAFWPARKPRPPAASVASTSVAST
jgi:hypothetical protein